MDFTAVQDVFAVTQYNLVGGYPAWLFFVDNCHEDTGFNDFNDIGEGKD